jgi:hypothetical protein
MRLDSLWIPFVAAVGGLGASCPRVSDDVVSAPVVIAAPAPAASPPTPPADVAPRPALPAGIAGVTPTAPTEPSGVDAIDPATLVTLPPELVDDGSDALAPEPPEPEPEPARVVDELASVARETWVFAEPRWSSRRLGYLRAGAIVERRARPAGHASCDGGWYRVEPRGYVCVGPTATLDVFDPVVEASSRRPRREGLPYPYVLSRFPTPPFYARVPTEAEQRDAEPDLAKHLRKTRALAQDPSFVALPEPEATPPALLYGQAAPGLANTQRSASLVLGRARVRSGFALLSTFEEHGRAFGLTTDLAVIPLDRTRLVAESSFAGLRLDDEVSLPVAFVTSRHARRYRVGEQGGVTVDEPLSFRQAIALSGEVRQVGQVRYLAARDGTLLREDQAVRIDRYKKAPAWVNRKWIDVSILRQSLIAYEGTKPVFVTLVSTGADGTGDPKKTHSTIQGAFLIHTKHVTVTMGGDDKGDEFELRDVPFVQYFTEGYALHAAYWHDDFGRPRSHGCVNLSPKDASWLFQWTDPEVPEAWHAALSLKKGTLVYVHP